MALMLIFTEIKTLSALKSAENTYSEHPLIQKILILINILQIGGKEIFIRQSHYNILGNEIVY